MDKHEVFITSNSFPCYQESQSYNLLFLMEWERQGESAALGSLLLTNSNIDDSYQKIGLH